LIDEEIAELRKRNSAAIEAMMRALTVDELDVLGRLIERRRKNFDANDLLNVRLIRLSELAPEARTAMIAAWDEELKRGLHRQ